MGDTNHEAFDDEDTDPGPCACGACRARSRLRELVIAARVTRLTSIETPSRGGAWTIYLEVADRTGAVQGSGASEEAALEAALRELGVRS